MEDAHESVIMFSDAIYHFPELRGNPLKPFAPEAVMATMLDVLP